MSILSAFSHLWPKCVASDNPSHSNLRRQLVRTLYWRINLEPRLHIWLLLILLLPCVWNVSSRPNCRHILFQFIFSKYFYVPAAFFLLPHNVSNDSSKSLHVHRKPTQEDKTARSLRISSKRLHCRDRESVRCKTEQEILFHHCKEGLVCHVCMLSITTVRTHGH